MNEFSPLQMLVIEEIRDLGQKIYKLYQEERMWRETLLTDVEKQSLASK